MTMFWEKPKPGPAKKRAAQYVLGVSAGEDGAAAAMLRDGKLIFSAFEPPAPGAAPAFPAAAVAAALEKASEAEGEILGVKDMAAVAFCGKPLREYERLRGEWLRAAPKGYARYMETAPLAFAKRRLAGGRLEKELSAASWGEKPARLLFPEHQLCCAASAFYPSPFEVSAILALDGPGEEAAASISLGSGGRIKLLRELVYPDSPQLLCAALAAYAGYPRDSAWELFTAPEPADRSSCDRLYKAMTGELAELREDGSLRLNRKYFSAGAGMRPDLPRWRELFGPPRAGAAQDAARLDFAAAARAAIEEIVFRLGAQAKRLAGSTNLCLCAGPELKLAAEGRLKAAGLFSGMWAQPYSAPEGKAAGAALAALHVGLGANRVTLAGAVRPWGETHEPELPEESESPEKLAAAAKPLAAASRLRYAAYYWLAVAPKGLRGEEAAEEEPGKSFYVSRNSRIYAPEDLAGPV